MPAFGSIITSDALTFLRNQESNSVHCCVTSPPYWRLRDYTTMPGQIGLEPTLEDHIAVLVQVFHLVLRVLRPDGTLWVNYGDTYWYNQNAGGVKVKRPAWAKPKDLLGLPWRLAIALQEDGWYLRSEVIWHKPNAMPESIKDRPVRAHEHLFLLSKSAQYYYDHKAVREPASASANKRKGSSYSFRRENSKRALGPANHPQGTHRPNRDDIAYCGPTRSRRDVWTISSRPFQDNHYAHYATYPPELIRPCILAGCPPGGVVLDPFFGSGTVGVVCVEEARRYLGIEINPDYVAMAERRIGQARPKGPQPLSLLDMGVA